MALFKKGDTVALKSVIPSGPIIGMRMDEDGNIQYCVEWTSGEDTLHRWFDEADLTAA
jgi:hypothetical protein